MTDARGRNIEYMRISVTDRCNLRCRYCMPEDIPSIGHDRILRYEEILRVCRAAVALGIRQFRVTGGEPLVRKGLPDFLGRLRALDGVEAVSLTTNGVLLEPLVPGLVEMGLDGVNISLDTLDREIYRQLTGQDALEAVMRSLKAAVTAGLRTKINCVPLEGVNDEALTGLAALAGTLPVDVRFIELMPTGTGRPFRGIPGAVVRERLLGRYPDLREAGEPRGPGPARYYKSGGLLGRIGFIDAMTGCFCAGCNRVRLTSDGVLKPCLYHDGGLSLRGLLRSGADDPALQNALEAAIRQKPERHHFEDSNIEGGIHNMSRIGG